MSVAYGCEDKNRTPVLEERTCPKCGLDMEVFLINGRIAEDSVCKCGYVVEAEEPLVIVPNIK